MIQSAANSSRQRSLGFENLARFGPQPTKAGEGVLASTASRDAGELTPEQQQQINQLKQIDAKVRAHEQAHISAGADLIRGGPSFSYTTGPDNKRYAVSGEVSIDTTPGRTPEETIPKAQHIRATALAPADPSPQDHSVAAQASELEGRARQELAARQFQEADGAGGANTAAFYRKVENAPVKATSIGSRLDLFA